LIQKGVETLKAILSIDQGTTNTKAVLVSEEGEILARAAQALEVSYPRPAWVEQDAMTLWASVREAIDSCLAQEPGVDLAAVAISNQRESVVAWERTTGLPIGPCVTWQCRRSAPICERLAEAGHAEAIHARTGLQLDPGFSAGKARWLLEHLENGVERARDGEVCVGTVDSWVLWNLTGGAVHRCDTTNASRTQLMNLETLAWDPTLTAWFGVPIEALPDIHPSSHPFGETVPVGDLPGGVPVAALIGDSHGALYGHAGFQPGAIKATYGTGTSLMMPMPAPTLSTRGISTTVAWSRGAQTTYALEGNISVTGAAVTWFGGLLGLDDPGPQTEALAAEVDDTDGVYLVPAFVGLGAPHWAPDARGTLTGITRGTGPTHVARATLESIAYQIRDVFDAMQAEAGTDLQVLMADGGASRNDLLMQFQADILDCPILRSTSSDVSARGAAYLAGLAAGVWASEAEVAALPRPQDRFEPQMPPEIRRARYAGWKDAVARTLYRPEDRSR
jgi:glycerol kinase